MSAPVVIKIGGRALDEADSRPDLWDTIASIARTTAGGLALVHGGGAAVDKHLGALGMRSERREGLRVTPPEHIGEVVAVLRGRVNTHLVGLLARREVPATGLGLSDGGACVCTRHEPGGIDLGRVGVLSESHPTCAELWQDCLRAGRTPVICSIGLDEAGQPLNVNADDAAVAVARIASARALVLLTDVPGIADESGETIDEITPEGIESLIERGVISGGMIPKARGAGDIASRHGFPVVIAGWEQPGHIAAACEGGSAGTRVVAERRPIGTGG